MITTHLSPASGANYLSSNVPFVWSQSWGLAFNITSVKLYLKQNDYSGSSTVIDVTAECLAAGNGNPVTKVVSLLPGNVYYWAVEYTYNDGTNGFIQYSRPLNYPFDDTYDLVSISPSSVPGQQSYDVLQTKLVMFGSVSGLNWLLPVQLPYGQNGDRVAVWGRYHWWDNQNIYAVFEGQGGQWIEIHNNSQRGDYSTCPVNDGGMTYDYQIPEGQASYQQICNIRGSIATDEFFYSSGGYSALVSTILAPEKVDLYSPVDIQTGLLSSFTFSWLTAQNADTYDIQVATDIGFGTIIINQTGIAGISYNASGLLYNTQYFWRVRGVRGASNGDWSDTWSFRTIYTPQAPTLTSPTNGQSNVTGNPILRWNDNLSIYGDAATSFTYEVSLDNLFTSIVASGTVSQPQADVGLSYITTYYWRVKSTNIAGTSGWSGIFSFQTLPFQSYAAAAQVAVSGVSGAVALDYYRKLILGGGHFR